MKQRAEDARVVVPNNRDCHLIGGAAPCASQSEIRGRGRKRVVFLSPLLSSMYDGGMPVVCMANSVIAASNEPTRRASKGHNGPRSEKTAPRRALRETARAHLRHGIHQILREQHETARRREQEHVADHAAAASWDDVLRQVESEQGTQWRIENMFALLSARRAAVLARRPFAVARRLQPDRKARSLQALFDSGWTPAVADSGPVDSYGASAVGRRKSAVANVIVRPGQGVFTINDRELIDYFPRDTHRDHVIQPFEFTDTLCDFDVTCRVHGGGLSGARAPPPACVDSLGFRARCPTAALTHSFRASRAAGGRQVKPARSASASVAPSRSSNRTIARC